MSHNIFLSMMPIQLGVVNSFLIKGDKVVIVDSGYPGNGERILDHLRTHHISLSDVSLILITHGHVDHYGSADELRKLTGAPIAMYRTDAEHIRNGTHFVGIPTSMAARIFKSLFIKADPFQSKLLEADIILQKDTDLEEYGVTGRIIQTPGHTAGSVSVVLSDGTVIIGDLLMGGILRKRTPHLPLFASDLSQLKESIKRVLSLSPKIIYPSHGGPFTKEAVERFFGKLL